MMGLHVVVPAVTVPIQFVGAIRTGQTDAEVLVTYIGVQQERVLVGGLLGPRTVRVSGMTETE